MTSTQLIQKLHTLLEHHIDRFIEEECPQVVQGDNEQAILELSHADKIELLLALQATLSDEIHQHVTDAIVYETKAMMNKIAPKEKSKRVVKSDRKKVNHEKMSETKFAQCKVYDVEYTLAECFPLTESIKSKPVYGYADGSGKSIGEYLKEDTCYMFFSHTDAAKYCIKLSGQSERNVNAAAALISSAKDTEDAAYNMIWSSTLPKKHSTLMACKSFHESIDTTEWVNSVNEKLPALLSDDEEDSE